MSRKASICFLVVLAVARPSPVTCSEANFTVDLSTPLKSRVLAAANDSWLLLKGTAEPDRRWNTLEPRFLTDNWQSRAAGFGYGYPNLATSLGDMNGRYSTIYARRSFRIREVIDPRRLRLQVDYDDGFVAYLNGREIVRANAPGSPGARPAYNSFATASHPASSGPGGRPAENFFPTPDSPALFVDFEDGPPIDQILAIQGLNRSLTDPSFALTPTLFVDDLFAVTTDSSLQLSGRAAFPDTSSVTVNGAPALYNRSDQTWGATLALRPGLNRMGIEVRNGANTILASATRDVLYKASVAPVSGTLSANTTWDRSKVFQVNQKVQVPAGGTLNIAPGTTVMFGPEGSIFTRGGTINITGTTNEPVFLVPSDGRTPWREIAGAGPNSTINLRFAEMVGAGVHLTNQVTLLIEDSILRDFSYDLDGFERYLVYTVDACRATVRRSKFLRYYAMAFGYETSLRMEDCLLEFAEHDFIKPQVTRGNSFIRRCSFRHGTVPGADGIDIGAKTEIEIDDCLFTGIPDKAISVEGSDITIRNCLVYDSGIAVGVKDDSNVILLNSTIANSKFGLATFLKNPGANFARSFATNNIIWGNDTNVTLRNPETGASPSSKASIKAGYNDIEGSLVYPGKKNINDNPLFVDAGGDNFALRPGSPALGSGLGGVNMGVTFPVGAFHTPPVLPLTIVAQPESQTVALGASIALSPTVSGAVPLSYQWRLNGLELPGATNSSLVIPNFGPGQEGAYELEVGNASGSVKTRAAMLLLDSPARFSYRHSASNQLNLLLIGKTNANFSLEASPDLLNWTTVLSNAVPNGILEFQAALTNASVFYRFKLTP